MNRADYCPNTGEPCQSLCQEPCGAAPNAWKEAVLDRLAINCMDAPKSESPESILRRVIDSEVSIALNPLVSERAQQLLERELAEANAIIAAMKDDYNRRPENEPIGMLIDTLSTRPRNIINFELSLFFPGEVLTLRHLCQFARSEVLKFPNLGKKSLREIEEYLRPRGVWWRGEA